MAAHTISSEEIDAIVNESSQAQQMVSPQSEAITLDGARTLLEEFANRLPKVTVGREPIESKKDGLKDGEIYLQY